MTQEQPKNRSVTRSIAVSVALTALVFTLLGFGAAYFLSATGAGVALAVGLLLCCAVALAVGTVASLLISKKIISPLKLHLNQDQGDSDDNSSQKPEPLQLPDNEIGEIIQAWIRSRQVSALSKKEMHEQLQSAKAQVVQSSKLSLIGELTATLAHDLKNPLTLIATSSLLLRRSLQKKSINVEKCLGILDKLDFGNQRLERLVLQMNNFSRDEQDYQENLEAAAVIEDALLLVDSKIVKNKVEVIRNIPDQTPHYWGAATQIEQVLMNLFSNAADAMQDQDTRELHITVRVLGEGSIEILVRDTGMGISEEHRDRIFTPFFTTKEKGQGTGLGLSICKQIIEDHGGQIAVSSVPGEGTTFSILLLRKKPSRNPVQKTA